jgi:hypothetical protein
LNSCAISELGDYKEKLRKRESFPLFSQISAKEKEMRMSTEDSPSYHTVR